ncbi:putative ribonuclease H-like domain-containing protein, partial [Tanacetum coccineum]
MNQSYEMKGIKREFSVAKTPQQNGVAERRNRTLIDVVRTMGLSNKPIITRHLMNLIFMKNPFDRLHEKPFGCPGSKALRVILNKRTRIVEVVTLTLDFLKITPNVIENGSILGFDVDSLTISDELSGPLLQANQNKLVLQELEIYIVSEEDAEEKPTKMDENGALDKDGKDDQATRSDTSVSVAGPSFTNDDPSSPVNVAEASNVFEEHLSEIFSPFKNEFTLPPISNVTPIDDTRIFGNAYDDEDVVVQRRTKSQRFQNAYLHVFLFKRKLKKQLIQVLDDPVSRSNCKRSFTNFNFKSFGHALIYVIGKKDIRTKLGLKSNQKKLYMVYIKLLEPGMRPCLHGFRRGTIDKTLFIKKDKDSPFDLEAFSDSDYAGASLDIKSTIEGCQFLGKRQVLWIQNQMLDYGFNFINTKIYIDNESTICIVKNPVFHSKTKHIEIRHHFIRDSYEKRLIQVIKIHTDHNVADLLTKAFDVSRFNFLVASIGFHHITDGYQFTMSNRQERIGYSRANDNCLVAHDLGSTRCFGVASMKEKRYEFAVLVIMSNMSVSKGIGGRSTLYCQREISTASIRRTVVTRVNIASLIFE